MRYTREQLREMAAQAFFAKANNDGRYGRMVDRLVERFPDMSRQAVNLRIMALLHC